MDLNSDNEELNREEYINDISNIVVRLSSLEMIARNLSREEFLRHSYDLTHMQNVILGIMHTEELSEKAKAANESGLFDSMCQTVYKNTSSENSPEDFKREWRRVLENPIDFEDITEQDDKDLEDTQQNPFEGK